MHGISVPSRDQQPFFRQRVYQYGGLGGLCRGAEGGDGNSDMTGELRHGWAGTPSSGEAARGTVLDEYIDNREATGWLGKKAHRLTNLRSIRQDILLCSCPDHHRQTCVPSSHLCSRRRPCLSSHRRRISQPPQILLLSWGRGCPPAPSSLERTMTVGRTPRIDGRRPPHTRRRSVWSSSPPPRLTFP